MALPDIIAENPDDRGRLIPFQRAAMVIYANPFHHPATVRRVAAVGRLSLVRKEIA